MVGKLHILLYAYLVFHVYVTVVYPEVTTQVESANQVLFITWPAMKLPMLIESANIGIKSAIFEDWKW